MSARILALLVLAAPLGAQDLVQAHDGTAVFERFGRAAAFVGDLDGDGFPDLVVGTDVGRVDVRSGRSGATIRSHLGPPGDDFGYAVAGPGDLDLDGVDDYVVGAPQLSSGGAGTVTAFSGATGATLWVLAGAQPQDKFGSVLGVMPDADGDGRAEILIGSPSAQNSQFEKGRAEIRSGTTGLVIQSYDGVAMNDHFGSALCSPGDLDGDLIPDLLVGAPGANQPPTGFFQGTGAVSAFSTLTGQLLFVRNGDAADDLFGAAIVGLGDIDADGIADWAVGAPGADPGGIANAGLLRVFVSSQATPLYDRPGTVAQQRYAETLASAGDLTADGFPEILVGAPNDPSLAPGGGSVETFDAVAGLLMHRVEGDVVFGGLGAALPDGRDLDGDGLAEVALVTRGYPAPTFARGRVAIASFRAFLDEGATGALLDPAGVPDPVLRVAGSPGDDAHRVEVGAGVPFAIEVRHPLAGGPPRSFAIFGAGTTPYLRDGLTLPGGAGRLCVIPCPLLPAAQPLLFTLVDGLFGGGCGAVFPATPTPWARFVPGLPAGVRAVFQGVIEDDAGGLVATNGILLVVD
ncbi:MAG: integrin alpha [Planctomycetota bacterium]